MTRVVKISELQARWFGGRGAKALDPHIHIYRVVECEPRQAGYLFEQGVVLVWQSGRFDSRGHGPGSRRAFLYVLAARSARHARRALAVGLSASAPACAVADLLEERGLSCRVCRHCGTEWWDEAPACRLCGNQGCPADGEVPEVGIESAPVWAVCGV